MQGLPAASVAQACDQPSSFIMVISSPNTGYGRRNLSWIPLLLLFPTGVAAIHEHRSPWALACPSGRLYTSLGHLLAESPSSSFSVPATARAIKIAAFFIAFLRHRFLCFLWCSTRAAVPTTLTAIISKYSSSLLDAVGLRGESIVRVPVLLTPRSTSGIFEMLRSRWPVKKPPSGHSSPISDLLLGDQLAESWAPI